METEPPYRCVGWRHHRSRCGPLSARLCAHLCARLCARRFERFVHESLQPRRFSSSVAGGGSFHPNWRAVCNRYSSKRFRNHEPIPARESPRAIYMRKRRHDRSAGTIGCDHCSRRELSRGAAWTVRSYCDVIAVLQCANDPEQCPVRTFGCRSPNRPVSHPLENARNYLSVVMLAHDDCHSLISMIPEKRKHLAVPQRKQNRRSRLA